MSVNVGVLPLVTALRRRLSRDGLQCSARKVHSATVHGSSSTEGPSHSLQVRLSPAATSGAEWATTAITTSSPHHRLLLTAHASSTCSIRLPLYTVYTTQCMHSTSHCQSHFSSVFHRLTPPPHWLLYQLHPKRDSATVFHLRPAAPRRPRHSPLICTTREAAPIQHLVPRPEPQALHSSQQ